jgi:hypothetical protein
MTINTTRISLSFVVLVAVATTLSILGGEWYTDDVPELGGKETAHGTRGKWILEFAELASIVPRIAAGSSPAD